MRERERERERERRERETGLNIANKIKYIFYSFSITKSQKFKENFSKILISYK